MPLVNMKDMLVHAYTHGYAVGAFDVVSLDFLEGIMAAAERARAPVILSLDESRSACYDLDLLTAAVEVAARRSPVPVSIHLNHGSGLESAVRAIRLGCNGIMLDASRSGLSDNLTATRTVVKMARACGVPVEGALGCVPVAASEEAGQHSGEIVYTTPAEAKSFVKLTGVDFLAVSIGTVQGRFKGKPKLDFPRLRNLNETLGIPLVIHGGTGLGDDQFRRLIANGVAKINCHTALSDAAARTVRTRAKVMAGASHTALMEEVRESVATEAERCLRVWGSAGRAAEVLARCRLWQAVEHLIIYDVADIGEQETLEMMAEGRRTLGSIPGVRKVITGQAEKKGREYRYCWLVRFAAPEVIDSYREHPDHTAFANRQFRPVAEKRISIDYVLEGV